MQIYIYIYVYIFAENIYIYTYHYILVMLLLPVTVTTKITTFQVRDPHKPCWDSLPCWKNCPRNLWIFWYQNLLLHLPRKGLSAKGERVICNITNSELGQNQLTPTNHKWLSNHPLLFLRIIMVEVQSFFFKDGPVFKMSLLKTHLFFQMHQKCISLNHVLLKQKRVL